MIDDLREQAGDASLFDDEEERLSFDDFDDYDDFEEEEGPKRRGKGGPFFGMTAAQRFMIASMLFLLSCVLSFFCLLITGRIMI
ncbi:MAG: hypothetical protein ACE5GO_06375 [Anaerolineales bacterium]